MNIEKGAELLKALSDPTRMRIALMLGHAELSVNEIVSALGMGQSRVSRHLGILTDCGVLECRRDGLWSFYTISSEGTGRYFFDFAESLLEDEIVKKDIASAKEIIRERSNRAKSYFNRVARDWDVSKKNILGDIDINAEVSALLSIKGVVADLGCGTGDLAAHLSSRGFQVIGVDSSAKMIETARSRSAAMKTKIDFRVGELEHLPFRDNELDSAVMVLALHHISSPDDAFKELSRVVKKRGTIVIADFEKHTNEKMREDYHDQWLGFTRRELSRWCEKAGLSIKSYSVKELKSGLSLAYTVIQK